MNTTTTSIAPQTSDLPVSSPVPAQSAPLSPLLWDTPQNSEHSVRVMCDNFGLSWSNKNIIWACIKQESDFMNYQPDGTPTKHENLNKDGTLSSTDWGIVQINDYYHIGEGKDFPSVDYVMQNPELMVKFMIQMFIEGKLGLWSSFKTGAYLKWLPYVE